MTLYRNICADERPVRKYTPPEIRHRKGVKRVIMSDTEINTISIIGELMSVDFERAWYGFCRKNLPIFFPHFYERNRFNRLHRNLHSVIQNLYEKDAKYFILCDLWVIDSLPYCRSDNLGARILQNFLSPWGLLWSLCWQERNLSRL